MLVGPCLPQLKEVIMMSVIFKLLTEISCLKNTAHMQGRHEPVCPLRHLIQWPPLVVPSTSKNLDKQKKAVNYFVQLRHVGACGRCNI